MTNTNIKEMETTLEEMRNTLKESEALLKAAKKQARAEKRAEDLENMKKTAKDVAETTYTVASTAAPYIAGLGTYSLLTNAIKAVTPECGTVATAGVFVIRHILALGAAEMVTHKTASIIKGAETAIHKYAEQQRINNAEHNML